MRLPITLILFILLQLLSVSSFSQSKKDLQYENYKLKTDQESINRELKLLKDQNAELKSEIQSLKEENHQLRSQAVNQNNNVASESKEVTDKNVKNTATGRCQAKTSKGTQCSRNTDAGSSYCWQHKATYEPNKTDAEAKPASGTSSTPKATSGSSSGSGREIQTGPRGGKYYINKNGNKTYVK